MLFENLNNELSEKEKEIEINQVVLQEKDKEIEQLTNKIKEMSESMKNFFDPSDPSQNCSF